MEGHDGGRLEAQVRLHNPHRQHTNQSNEEEGGERGEGRDGYLEVLRDLTDETLEGQLADEELCRFLVPTDFTESDCSGAEAVRLLHTTGGSLRHPTPNTRQDSQTTKRRREREETYGGGGLAS